MKKRSNKSKNYLWPEDLFYAPYVVFGMLCYVVPSTIVVIVKEYDVLPILIHIVVAGLLFLCMMLARRWPKLGKVETSPFADTIVFAILIAILTNLWLVPEILKWTAQYYG